MHVALDDLSQPGCHSPASLLGCGEESPCKMPVVFVHWPLPLCWEAIGVPGLSQNALNNRGSLEGTGEALAGLFRRPWVPEDLSLSLGRAAALSIPGAVPGLYPRLAPANSWRQSTLSSRGFSKTEMIFPKASRKHVPGVSSAQISPRGFAHQSPPLREPQALGLCLAGARKLSG